MADVWREKVQVRFGSVDRSDRLTLWSIFNFFQEAAISHATDLGVGREDLLQKKQAWILSRLSVFVERRPACGEIVQVSTWPRRTDRLFALRDYEIRDAEDIAVVRGRGAWLVLDIEKRLPLRAQWVTEKLPPNDGLDAFPAGPAALKKSENFVKNAVRAASRAALYSDIDYYGHANNARYIQWIQDAADMDLLTNTAQFRLDINYLSEVLPGETVELWTAQLEDEPGNNINLADYPKEAGSAFACEGRRPGTPESSGQTVFRAELRTGM